MEFAQTFETLCRDSIRPGLERLERNGRMRRQPAVTVFEVAGPTERNRDGKFSGNRRVVLEVESRGSLAFIAWEPAVLVHFHIPGAGYWQALRPEEVTPDEVERIARGFLTALTTD